MLFLLVLPDRAGALQPEPVFGEGTAPVWEGQQFVQADRAGRLYFYRSDTFQVYPVTKDGRFGDPVGLQTAVAASGTTTFNAVMSLAGDQWLIQGHRSARLFVDGKEKPIPALPYKPWSVTFLRNTPVAAVIPLPMGGRSVDLQKIGTPPWFVQLGTNRWDTLVNLKGFTVPEILEGDGLNRATAEYASFLAGDRQGKLWAARQYGYRVQRFSPAGRVLLDISVDGGEVRRNGQSKEIEVKPKGAAIPGDAARNQGQEKASHYEFTAQSAIEALTEGRDGRLYLFVKTPQGGMALDRYDPARAVLERVLLRINLKNRPSLAAGRDGLYLAAWNARNGRWRISWEALEQADWKKVQNCKIDGFDEE